VIFAELARRPDRALVAVRTRRGAVFTPWRGGCRAVDVARNDQERWTSRGARVRIRRPIGAESRVDGPTIRSVGVALAAL